MSLLARDGWSGRHAQRRERDSVERRSRSSPLRDSMQRTLPAATETFSAGIPVEVGQIQRELKKLWDAGDGVMTRASLINLAVYSEAPDSLGKNTAILSRLTEEHACRAIVIAADPSAQGKPGRGLDQRALPRQPRRKQTGLLGAALLFPPGQAVRFPSQHCLRPARFRSAALSLVAGGIPRPARSAALGLGRSRDLRQPDLARISASRWTGRRCAEGGAAPHRSLRPQLGAPRPSSPRACAVFRSPRDPSSSR